MRPRYVPGCFTPELGWMVQPRTCVSPDHRLRPGMPGATVLMPVGMLVREDAFRHGAGVIDRRTT